MDTHSGIILRIQSLIRYAWYAEETNRRDTGAREMEMPDYISDTIERSRLRFNPRLAQACLELVRVFNEESPQERRCWRFMQALFMIQQDMPMNLPFCWYKEGVVVYPESLIQQIGGIIKFRWDKECHGC